MTSPRLKLLILVAELMAASSGYAQNWPAISEVQRPTPTTAYLHSAASKNPAWAAEYITRASVQGGAVRKDFFEEDLSQPPQARSRNSDYERSGYARGHLNPAGDWGAQTEQDATFTLANVVPQAKKNNQGIWQRVENEVRSLVEPSGTLGAHVVTGPAYLPDSKGVIHTKTIGSGVWVPTHIWKAALVIEEGWERTDFDTQKRREVAKEMRAWLVPNEDSASGEIAQYRVSVDALEKATGLELFGWLEDEIENDMEKGK